MICLEIMHEALDPRKLIILQRNYQHAVFYTFLIRFFDHLLFDAPASRKIVFYLNLFPITQNKVSHANYKANPLGTQRHYFAKKPQKNRATRTSPWFNSFIILTKSPWSRRTRKLILERRNNSQVSRSSINSTAKKLIKKSSSNININVTLYGNPRQPTGCLPMGFFAQLVCFKAIQSVARPPVLLKQLNSNSRYDQLK